MPKRNMCMSLNVTSVESDLIQSQVVSHWINTSGMVCSAYNSVSTAISGLNTQAADIILLSDSLDDHSSLKLLAHLRCRLHSHVPVVMVYSLFSAEKISTALHAGADDFLMRPLRKSNLTSYLYDLAKHCVQQQTLLNCYPYKFDTINKDVHLDGVPLRLSECEYALAAYIFFFRNRFVFAEELAREVWSDNSTERVRDVEIQMARLKKRLKLKSTYSLWKLQSLQGIGYRLNSGSTISEQIGCIPEHTPVAD